MCVCVCVCVLKIPRTQFNIWKNDPKPHHQHRHRVPQKTQILLSVSHHPSL